MTNTIVITSTNICPYVDQAPASTTLPSLGKNDKALTDLSKSLFSLVQSFKIDGEEKATQNNGF
jgi:hypothetical protein